METKAPTHIFFIPWMEDQDSFWRVIKSTRFLSQKIIPAFTEEHIKTILGVLPSHNEVILWAHLGKHDQDSGGTPQNLKYGKTLKRKNIIGNKATLNFFTTGHLGDISNGQLGQNPNMLIIKGNPIYCLDILDPDYQNQMPKSQVVRDILPYTYQSIKTYQFDSPPAVQTLQVQVEQQIPKADFSCILGECLPKGSKDIFITPLSGGLSGTFVLKVLFHLKTQPLCKVIKIGKANQGIQQEHLFSEEITLKRLGRQFLGAEGTLKQVYDWHCIVFNYLDQNKSLRSLLKEGMQDHTQQRKLAQIIERTLDIYSKFEVSVGDLTIKRFRPWSSNPSDDIQYKGLIIPKDLQIKIYYQINKTLEEISPKRIEQLGISKQLPFLFEFIENQESNQPKYKSKLIEQFEDSQFHRLPIAKVHGDFHSQNILFQLDMDELVFIDFSKVINLTYKHAFVDYAKFSTDLETNIIPIKEDQWSLVESTRRAHLAWIDGSLSKPDETLLSNLYSWNNLIRKRLLTRFGEVLSKDEINYQFLLVRLHYLLKAIAYHQISREKRVLLTCLAIDTLDFLTEN